MASSGRLSKAVNAVVPLWDALYILQLEEYRVGRLAKWLPRFLFRRNIARRQTLLYTPRAKTILAASIALWIAAAAFVVASPLSLVPRVAAIVLLCLLAHLFVAAATWILWPVHHFAALRLMRNAAALVASRKNLRVVAIAGSYGKTTTKHLVHQFVRHTLPTQMVPGTINTPRGIAAWILKNLQPSTELLIVEMDAYQPGEIAQSCRITPPDIAVVTNAGDQHLERFGSKERLARALAETFSRSKPKAVCVCDGETFEHLGRPALDGRVLRLAESGPLSYHGVLIDDAAMSASTRANVRLTLAVADLVGVPERFVADACVAPELPERRQLRTTMYGYDAVDDSYNISFSTAQAGIAAGRDLARERGKKLLVVTAGIPELGPEDQNKNRLLGSLLREQADHTVVLGSMFAEEIVRGFEAAADRYTAAADLNAFLATAHASFPPSEWALLMQPELNDLYY